MQEIKIVVAIQNVDTSRGTRLLIRMLISKQCILIRILLAYGIYGYQAYVQTPCTNAKSDKMFASFLFGIVCPVCNIYTGLGCLVTLLCSLIISPTLSPIVAPKYKQFGKHKKAYWDTLLGSTFHAIVSATVGIYALLFDQLNNEYIISQSPIGKSLIQFCLGYFCVDLVLCLLDSEMRKDVMSTLHHTLAVVGTWLAVCHEGVATYWVVLRLTTELSTPFVNVLWYLLFINYPKKSTLFITNSLLLVVTFYGCRIFTIPYNWIAMYYRVYLNSSTPAIWPTSIMYWIVMSNIVVDVFNIIWAYKITRGSYKSLKQLQKSS